MTRTILCICILMVGFVIPGHGLTRGYQGGRFVSIVETYSASRIGVPGDNRLFNDEQSSIVAEQSNKTSMNSRLPEIVVAIECRLIASPLQPAAYLPCEPVPAGERVRVLATEKNSAWLLVLHAGTLGWMPVIFSNTPVGNLQLPVVNELDLTACAMYLDATFTVNESWQSRGEGKVVVQGLVYAPRPATAFKRATISPKIEGAGWVSESQIDYVQVSESGEILLFTYAVEDLHPASQIGFQLSTPSQEPATFQAAFYRYACPNLGPTQTPPGRAPEPSPTSTRSPVPSIVVTSEQTTGKVTSSTLNVRSGPGTEYPALGRLREGEKVEILGYNTASDGSVWWRIRSASTNPGWVHSGYVDRKGTEHIPEVPKPPAPPTPTPTPPPIASNRDDLGQSQNGWTYQYENGRNSVNFTAFTDRRSYNDADCYVSPREDYVRICHNGELHPGQEGRVAYRWDSNYEGPAVIAVHAHKMDTRCGDGIWVGIYLGQQGQPPGRLGEFKIGGGDNSGVTEKYSVDLTYSTYLLTMIDIRGTAECDQSRVYIDILPE